MLYALDNIVFLISSMYICHRDHEFMSHDARVLALFPPKIDIPFVLAHRTGFTAELIGSLNSRMQSCCLEGFQLSRLSNTPTDTLLKCFLLKFSSCT